MSAQATIWSNRLLMDSWIQFLVFLTVVPSVSHSATSSSTCPRDLESRVNDCFTSYSIHSQSLNNSPRKLCCGVDIETLRLFCHSYKSAVDCVMTLKNQCPSTQHHTIDRMLTNLDGESKAGLMDLCKDDHVIESYAIYQSCFEMVGHRSENCFSSYLNVDSSTIRFLSKVNTKHKDGFCRNMRYTVGCVQHSVQACGPGSSDLAVLLVRPMVRDSSQCDYTIVNDDNTGSKTTDREGPAYISDDSRYNRDSKSGSSGSGAKNSNNNQRRHKNRNSNNNNNSDQPSSRGANAGSHSSSSTDNKNPGGGGGAAGLHLTGIHCSRVLFITMSFLLTVMLKKILIGSNC